MASQNLSKIDQQIKIILTSKFMAPLRCHQCGGVGASWHRSGAMSSEKVNKNFIVYNNTDKIYIF
jgi:archaellum component FlaG (FlaF/FlaG flagellin family)